MSELSTSSNVEDDDTLCWVLAECSSSSSSSSRCYRWCKRIGTAKAGEYSSTKQLHKHLSKKSSAAAAASASSGARVTDDPAIEKASSSAAASASSGSMRTQQQLKKDLAVASVRSSSNTIYGSGSASASWREYYRSCGWSNACISAGAAAPAAAATNSSSSSSSSSSSNSTAASAATRHKITNKKLDKHKVPMAGVDGEWQFL